MRDISEKIVFRPDDHTYWLGDRQLPSVTQLLHRHGLSADLSGAPQDAVRRAGEHGTLVHEEIETFIRTGEMGITDEFQDFLKLVYPLAEHWDCEVMVWTDDYAGRADLIGLRDDCVLVVDTKTGVLNQNATAWQTSMYANALPEKIRKDIRLYAFDAKMDGKSRLVSLEPVSDACINDLLKAEAEGRRYNPILPVVTENEKMLEVERSILTLERQLAELKAQDEAFRAMLMQAMEKGRVMSFESDRLRVAYVAPYNRTTLDSKAVQKKYPKVYDECLRTSTVKASVRLTLRGDD